jgi:glycogen debranching enzyme
MMLSLALGAALAATAGVPADERPAIVRDLQIADPGRNPYLTLDEWLDDAPEPRLADPARRRAAYRAWATFWVDTQPPGGAWPRPIISPGASYMRGIWLWDTGFHVLGLLHGGPKARRLAAWQIEVMLSGQDPSGKIPREIHRDGPKFLGDFGIQAPGILTLAANRLHATARDDRERSDLRALLAEAYPKLVRNHEWFFAHVDKGRGLCGWRGWDSGWDDSPRWDGGVKEALDLDCWLYLDRVELAAMARTLGKPDDARAWDERAVALRDLIRKHHWNEALGAYNDTGPDGAPTSAVTPVVAWPLWTGVATPEQARRTMRLLTDPDELATPWPLSSASRRSPRYDPRGYWRGPTWINLNWVAIRGLQRHGFHAEAATLRAKTLDLVARTPILHEYYDSQTGDGIGSPHYGWTAALYIDLAMDRE